MTDPEEGDLKFCTAQRDGDSVTVTYRWENLPTNGSDYFSEEGLESWSDDDVVGFVSDMLGLTDEQAEKVEVTYV